MEIVLGKWKMQCVLWVKIGQRWREGKSNVSGENDYVEDRMRTCTVQVRGSNSVLNGVAKMV
jgi:hypothetical protein